jgi:hypothetical protein
MTTEDKINKNTNEMPLEKTIIFQVKNKTNT